MTSQSINLSELQPILERYAASGRSGLLPALWAAQDVYGYLSEPVVAALGRALKVPLVDVHGVIEFYTMFYNEPVGQTFVRVCVSPMCTQAGSHQILEAVCEHFGVQPGETTADGKFTIEAVECLGLCDHAPAALVDHIPVALQPGEQPVTWIQQPVPAPLGTIGGTPRWLSGRCGRIPATDLRAFVDQAGFAGLKRALEMQPADVIAMVTESGLSGRGGAAFPTGLKWKFTAGVEGEPKYIVCNADESEPGTFKDRVLMEGDPFYIIEGMLIAAYAIGAEQGYIYVRGEYPRAQAILNQALTVARQAGYLGPDILGSGFAFDIEVRSGAGAYICGEETALFESIEGKRGFPRLKPPFPTTHGLFHKPTVINNVETFCAAAWILANDPQAYRSVGTEKSPGTKLFCLSGDIAQPGVYEAPFGVTLKNLIELAGGVQGELQAVLLGGAAGAFARPDQLNLAMSFEALWGVNLSLGSGVINVINTDRDLRQYLLSLAHFFRHESCGKCFPCQLGTQRQLELMTKVASGTATPVDLETLQDVGFTMTQASLCGLGQTAATAILSALDHWPEIFENAS
ncbi:MAG: NAD(P)H-dependent oxidoreductase subunit E [Anaerolineales bacterium]|nr:NAD(P)H-dependent oxidoreductase subunit E [Anaerolineales bacterium]